MQKIALKKGLKQFYQVSAKAVTQVHAPPLRYLMVDGQGDPNTSREYTQAVEALFSVSYTAKFAVKKGDQKIDYAVMPLEGLWWADDQSVFVEGDKSQWNRTMMILQPSFVANDTIEAAIADVRRRRGSAAALSKLRVEEFTEGKCSQILNVGPFSAEEPTIQKLHAHIVAHGSLAVKHHEIYLSDVRRRAAAARWKTILRQPMQ